ILAHCSHLSSWIHHDTVKRTPPVETSHFSPGSTDSPVSPRLSLYALGRFPKRHHNLLDFHPGVAHGGGGGIATAPRGPLSRRGSSSRPDVDDAPAGRRAIHRHVRSAADDDVGRIVADERSDLLIGHVVTEGFQRVGRGAVHEDELAAVF